MAAEKNHEFVIRCDGKPSKLIMLRPSVLMRFIQKLRQRFPEHEWAVSDRFQPQGSD